MKPLGKDPSWPFPASGDCLHSWAHGSSTPISASIFRWCCPLCLSSCCLTSSFFQWDLFIHFCLRGFFIAAYELSLVVVSGSYSLLPCMGFSLWWLHLLWSTVFTCLGFSSCTGSFSWHMGLLHQLNNDLSIFGCTGSFLLHMGSLSLWCVGAALYHLAVAASLVEHRL